MRTYLVPVYAWQNLATSCYLDIYDEQWQYQTSKRYICPRACIKHHREIHAFHLACSSLACLQYYQSFWSADIAQGDNIKYNTECMYNSLLRTIGLGCGETSPLSLPCAPESVKTRSSSGVYVYSAKLLWKSIYAYKCSFMSKFCNLNHSMYFLNISITGPQCTFLPMWTPFCLDPEPTNQPTIV